jgi:tetratricopeptide (TPR) repeat protein
MLTKNPADGFALCSMGSVQLKLGELDKAQEYLDRAIEIYPGLGEAYLNRGMLLELKGDLEGACSDWKMAETLGIEASGEFLKDCPKP